MADKPTPSWDPGDNPEWIAVTQPDRPRNRDEVMQDLRRRVSSQEERPLDDIANEGDADFLDFAAFKFRGIEERPYYGRIEPEFEQARMISNQYY